MDGGDEVNPQVVPAWAAIPWSCTPLSMSSPLSCDLSCSLFPAENGHFSRVGLPASPRIQLGAAGPGGAGSWGWSIPGAP